jgi:hypothetical protein
VVSQKPAIGMEGSTLLLAPKEEATSTAPYVALAGRVRVKVSLENAPIAIGDYLVFSNTEGAAMKQTESGRVIGMALEPHDDSSKDSKLLVFINPHWRMGALGNSGLFEGEIAQDGESLISDMDSDSLSLLSSLANRVRDTLQSFRGIVRAGGEWVFERITAKKAQVEKAEIEKAEIRNLEVLEAIQVRDQQTGEIYCTWLENGEWVKMKGECQNNNDVENNEIRAPEKPKVKPTNTSKGSQSLPSNKKETTGSAATTSQSTPSSNQSSPANKENKTESAATTTRNSPSSNQENASSKEKASEVIENNEVKDELKPKIPLSSSTGNTSTTATSSILEPAIPTIAPGLNQY